MTLVLIFIFNWWILFLISNGILTFIYPSTSYLTFLIIGGTFLILSSWVFLINSLPGHWILKWMSGARAPIPREKNKLMILLQETQEEIQQRMGPPPFSIDVVVRDNVRPNASALGRKTLIVSRTLYETLSNEELKSVFAHELGHFHKGDTSKLTLVVGLNGVSLIFLWLMKKFIKASKFIEDWIGRPRGKEDILLKFPILFVMRVIQGICWLFEAIIKIGDKI